MAVFSFNCPSCNASLSVEDEYCGMTAQCPMCEKNIIIPDKQSKKNPVILVINVPKGISWLGDIIKRNKKKCFLGTALAFLLIIVICFICGGNSEKEYDTKNKEYDVPKEEYVTRKSNQDEIEKEKMGTLLLLSVAAKLKEQQELNSRLQKQKEKNSWYRPLGSTTCRNCGGSGIWRTSGSSLQQCITCGGTGYTSTNVLY